MKALIRAGTLFALAAMLTVAWALQKGPGTEAHGPSQSAADVLRDLANADGAFMAAGLVKDSFQADNLATMLQYPEDEIVVLGLKGSQIKQAFERSVSLYPQPNTSFLQISGFEVVFDPSADPNQRIKRVTAGGSPLDDGKTYNVAMPASLGRGGLGYFKIWEKKMIVQTLANVTMEKALSGKKAGDSAPRWKIER